MFLVTFYLLSAKTKLNQKCVFKYFSLKEHLPFSGLYFGTNLKVIPSKLRPIPFT